MIVDRVVFVFFFLRIANTLRLRLRLRLRYIRCLIEFLRLKNRNNTVNMRHNLIYNIIIFSSFRGVVSWQGNTFWFFNLQLAADLFAKRKIRFKMFEFSSGNGQVKIHCMYTDEKFLWKDQTRDREKWRKKTITKTELLWSSKDSFAAIWV